MSVIIAKSMGSWMWTCQTLVDKKGNGNYEKCGHAGMAETDRAASEAYEKHKKSTRGH